MKFKKQLDQLVRIGTLVEEGLTGAQIARRLKISEREVRYCIRDLREVGVKIKRKRTGTSKPWFVSSIESWGRLQSAVQ